MTARFLRRLPWPAGTEITQQYGVLSITGSVHCGLDGGLAEGTPLVPGAAGIVVPFTNSMVTFQGRAVRAFGLGVCVLYDEAPVAGPCYGLLAHCSELRVQAGDHVEADQVVALSGSTGASTGGHCHFAVCDTPAFPIDLRHYADPHSLLITEDPDMTLAEDLLLALLATPQEVALLPAEREAVLADARTRLRKVLTAGDDYPDGGLAFRVWAAEEALRSHGILG